MPAELRGLQPGAARTGVGLDPWTCPMSNLEWDIEEEQMVQELLDTLVMD